MDFSFVGQTPEISEHAKQLLLACPQCPLVAKKQVNVFEHEEGLVFQHEDGFSFYRKSTETESPLATFGAYIRDTATQYYLPVTYEIDADPTIPAKILNQFEMRYGTSMASRIDSLLHTRVGKRCLTVHIPREIVELMMCEQGGILHSAFSGTAAALRKVPLLVSEVPESAKDDEMIRRVFAVGYKQGEHALARALHMQVLQQIVKAPASGISFGPIAVWNP
jgi:hypothetical protein